MIKLTVLQAESQCGSLSNTTKMPGLSYGLPAQECKVGTELRKVENSVCHKCYAFRGNYNFKNVKKAQYKRLASIYDANWVESMAFLINKKTRSKDPYFRWHDSGDLQSINHLTKIVEVCKLTPQIQHWCPTREYGIVREWRKEFGSFPANLIVRLSAHMIDGPLPDKEGIHISSVSTKDDIYPDANHCPARFQDNSCADCRACWDNNIFHVSYHKH